MAKLGGKRPGAGRKPGSANRKTREIADAAATGLTPLEWMLAVIRDESADPKRRDDMAKAATPFMHPRLSAVEYVDKEKGATPPPLDVKITFVPGGPVLSGSFVCGPGRRCC